jgi:hypothetical protein
MEKKIIDRRVPNVRDDVSVLKLKFNRVPAWLVFSEYDDWHRFYFEVFRHRRHSMPRYVPQSSLLPNARRGIIDITGNATREEWQIIFKPDFISPQEIIKFFSDIGFSVTVHHEI